MAHQRLSTLPLRRTQTELGEPALRIDAALDPPTLAAQLHQWLSETTATMPDRSRLLELARQALTADPDRQPELTLGRSVSAGVARSDCRYHSPSVDSWVSQDGDGG